MQSVEYLSTQPEAGQLEELLQKLGQNSRYIIEGNYKIIYEYNEKQIIITDLFHSKQNPSKIVTRNNK
jgi:toxin ParE1/3/4